MRRGWLTILFVVACGLLISSQTNLYAQGIPSLDEGSGASGGGGAETAPAPSGGGGSTDEAPAPSGGNGNGESEEAEGEGGGQQQGGTEEVSVFTLVINNSGIPGAIIILLSTVAMYLTGQMIFSLRRSELMPEEFIYALEDDLEDLDLRDAMERCLRSECTLARVMEAGLREVRAGYDEMITAMEEAGEAESIRWHQHVGWLSVIGAISPMLGLTGTVLGMMAAFGTISQMSQQPEPAVLANDIQLALTTTCEGLVVAVPVLVAYAVFKNRVTSLMLDIGVAGEDLLSRFKHVETTPAMAAEVREAIESAAHVPEEEPEDMPAEGEPEPPAPEQEEDVPPPPPPE